MTEPDPASSNPVSSNPVSSNPVSSNRDLSNLEFWSERRGTGARAPYRPRKRDRHVRFGRLSSWSARLAALRFSARRRGTDGRVPDARAPAGPRPAAAAALLAGLAATWWIAGHRSQGSAVADVRSPVSTIPSTSAQPATDLPPPDAIALAVVEVPRCAGLSPARPHVRCVMAAGGTDIARGTTEVAYGEMEIALYTPGTVGPAFRRAAGAELRARSGPPACAMGRPDERAWSVASDPSHAVGRYVCRAESGHAAMWWTHGDRLVHARARTTAISPSCSRGGARIRRASSVPNSVPTCPTPTRTAPRAQTRAIIPMAVSRAMSSSSCGRRTPRPRCTSSSGSTSSRATTRRS